jgi:hypothetical protein
MKAITINSDNVFDIIEHAINIIDMRSEKVGGAILNIEKEAQRIILDLPSELKTGYRTLFLLERTKDGGHNKEDRRAFMFTVVTDEQMLLIKLKEFLWLKYLYAEKNLRIYYSVNARHPQKTVRNILLAITDSLYADKSNRELIAKKIIKGSRSYIMNPNAKETSFFLLDVDDEAGRDIMGETLQEMGDKGIEEVYRTKTRNGWHVVVKPFNPNIWEGKAEIKKDALIFLN